MENQEQYFKGYFPEQSDEDIETITSLLGKSPRGEFQIVLRNEKGNPSVIENAPFFFDGTPMPTRYWLVDPDLVYYVSRIESQGGVKQVQEEISLEDISKIHTRYQLSRDKMIDENYEGPKPSGGVGGTRRGVKCLHTHVAHFLVTGDDIVGKWTIDKIEDLEKDIS